MSALLAGCQLTPPADPWGGQVQAEGPCYDANLLDGLDTSSTDELHDVFACVNGTGALDALAPVDAAWDSSTRDGPAGLVFASWVNGLSLEGLSIPDALDAARALLSAPEDWWPWLEIGLELIYAAPYPSLDSSVPLDDPDALAGGALLPLLPVVGDLTTTLLDTDMAVFPLLQDALRADWLASAAWMAVGIEGSTAPQLQELAASWPSALADLFSRVTDTSNDRSFSPTGNSLRDLLNIVLAEHPDGGTVASSLLQDMQPILADDVAAVSVELWLEDEADADRLVMLPSWLLALASEDVSGGSLSSGEDSALVSLLRLLAAGNTEVDCSVLGIDFSLGNLSVSLLSTIAGLDPDTTIGGVELLGDVLGYSLTDDILYAVADTGVCPAITTELVADLQSVDRLNDPAVSGLLAQLIGVLQALDGHIDTLVDLLTEVHTLGLVPPLEEVLRDLGDAPLLTDVLELVPLLIEPGDAWAHVPVAPLSFSDIWGLLEDLSQQDLSTLRPLVEVGLQAEGTWTALERLGGLLDQSSATITGLLPLLADLLGEDPELEIATDLADQLDDPEALRPALVLVEGEGMRGALEASQPGPLPFFATLTCGGTLDVLVDTLSLLLTLFPEEPS